MTQVQMPTTLPSPTDRGVFQFIAVDTTGTEWFWIDSEMVWRPVCDESRSVPIEGENDTHCNDGRISV